MAKNTIDIDFDLLIANSLNLALKKVDVITKNCIKLIELGVPVEVINPILESLNKVKDFPYKKQTNSTKE